MSYLLAFTMCQLLTPQLQTADQLHISVRVCVIDSDLRFMCVCERVR